MQPNKNINQCVERWPCPCFVASAPSSVSTEHAIYAPDWHIMFALVRVKIQCLCVPFFPFGSFRSLQTSLETGTFLDLRNIPYFNGQTLRTPAILVGALGVFVGITKRWKHEWNAINVLHSCLSKSARAHTHIPNKNLFKLFNKCLQNYSIDHWPIFRWNISNHPSKLLIIFNGHSHANTFTNAQKQLPAHRHTHTQTHTGLVSFCSRWVCTQSISGRIWVNIY